MAHPTNHRSEINAPMFQIAQKITGITAVDLYHEYPRFNIDIDREQQRLLEHDTILFQFPLYWYSTPAILKEWQDLVLEYGFAYGRDGTALHGKRFGLVLTAGGKADAYHAEGYNHFTIDELMRPLEQMARMTGMEFLPPFALFGARTARDDGGLTQHLVDWQVHLNQLVGGA